MVTIHAETAHINWSPVGFYLCGRDYFNYIDGTKKPAGRYSPVPYFLICQSLELLMKAWLSANGVSVTKLRQKRYGHNLKNLLELCEQQKLRRYVRITDVRRKNIEFASLYYEPRKFNYGDIYAAMRAYPDLPDFRVLDRFAKILIDKLYEPVMQASRNEFAA